MNNVLNEYSTFSGEWLDQHIFHLQLNRPKLMNAMNPTFFKELPLIVEFLNKQDDLRVVLLTGNGKCFSAGLDLSEAGELLS